MLGNRETANGAVPSIVIAAEQYNMLARLAAANEPVELRIELRTQYHEDDLNTYNVIADIPGTDPALRDQVVLLGAHLDSWHTANGATDNGDGAVAAMEAMRILTAVGARPRGTIAWRYGAVKSRDCLARAPTSRSISPPGRTATN